jgi:cell division protein FtsB
MLAYTHKLWGYMIPHHCPHPYHQMKRRRLIERYSLLTVIAGLLLSFVIGRESVKNTDEYQAESAQLKMSVERLSAENEKLVKRQDFVENSQKIDLQARKDSRRSLTKLHGDLSVVKEQLAFYQRVVAPETLVKGLYINSFELKQGDEAGRYHYQLVVAQGASQKRALKGQYRLSVAGKMKGKRKTLSLKDIAIDTKQRKVFSFRYYEILSGEITLPSGFNPESIRVKVKPSSKKAKAVEQLWAWSDLIKDN